MFHNSQRITLTFSSSPKYSNYARFSLKERENICRRRVALCHFHMGGCVWTLGIVSRGFFATILMVYLLRELAPLPSPACKAMGYIYGIQLKYEKKVLFYGFHLVHNKYVAWKENQIKCLLQKTYRWCTKNIENWLCYMYCRVVLICSVLTTYMWKSSTRMVSIFTTPTIFIGFRSMTWSLALESDVILFTSPL